MPTTAASPRATRTSFSLMRRAHAMPRPAPKHRGEGSARQGLAASPPSLTKTL